MTQNTSNLLKHWQRYHVSMPLTRYIFTHITQNFLTIRCAVDISGKPHRTAIF